MDDRELLQQLMTLHNGGLTQAQAADLLGMTQPGVHNVLSGKSNLSNTGRAFVRYLLQDGERVAREPRINDEWATTLYRIAREMEQAQYVPPEYLGESPAYDVG